MTAEPTPDDFYRAVAQAVKDVRKAGKCDDQLRVFGRDVVPRAGEILAEEGFKIEHFPSGGGRWAEVQICDGNELET